ncbi:MAG: hypothetical protein WD139_02535, partial [Balneolaceae bacterium]
ASAGCSVRTRFLPPVAPGAIHVEHLWCSVPGSHYSDQWLNRLKDPQTLGYYLHITFLELSCSSQEMKLYNPDQFRQNIPIRRGGLNVNSPGCNPGSEIYPTSVNPGVG